jgi:CheY-like chemotaxis protein
MSDLIEPKKSRHAADFLAEVVHELRAPLGGVEAMAELLSATDLAPEQQRLVDGLRAAAAHLRAVANDVLDDSALKKGHFKCIDGPIELKTFVSALATSAGARATAKGLRFTLEFDDNLPNYVLGDDRRIRQMLENLLDNAMKVTPSGDIRLSVKHVDRRGSFEGLKFVISDTGPGFSEEQRAVLFRAYEKLNNGVAGTGLGLSLVRRFANAMGGEAGCESVEGCGATFWFTLRLKAATSTQDCQNEPEHFSPDHDTASAPSNCILIVDDNQTNRMIMAAVLEHFGYQIAEASSGEAALTMIQETHFDAIMMDQTLPGISGVETLKAIRAMPSERGTIPVIPVTGRVSKVDREAFAAAGANGFIEKPVTARAVRQALTEAIVEEFVRDKNAA